MDKSKMSLKVMRLVSVCIFGLFLITASCKEENIEDDFPIKAMVLSENIDCHQFQIKILNDLDKIISLFGKSVIDSVYIAGNLPDSMKIPGLEIIIEVSKPLSSTEISCSMMGATINWIWITQAKPY